MDIFSKIDLKSPIFNLQKWFRYKNRLEFNFQSNAPMCPKFGAFSEPFPGKVRIQSKSPIFGADESSGRALTAPKMTFGLFTVVKRIVSKKCTPPPS